MAKWSIERIALASLAIIPLAATVLDNYRLSGELEQEKAKSSLALEAAKPTSAWLNEGPSNTFYIAVYNKTQGLATGFFQDPNYNSTNWPVGRYITEEQMAKEATE